MYLLTENPWEGEAEWFHLDFSNGLSWQIRLLWKCPYPQFFHVQQTNHSSKPPRHTATSAKGDEVWKSIGTEWKITTKKGGGGNEKKEAAFHKKRWIFFGAPSKKTVTNTSKGKATSLRTEILFLTFLFHSEKKALHEDIPHAWWFQHIISQYHRPESSHPTLIAEKSASLINANQEPVH